jgi:stage II sporulation protein R
MKTSSGQKLKKWELALLLALCVTLLWGAWAQGQSDALAGELIRLHVLAVSDDPEEQAVKLRVRDAVLAYLSPRLAEAGSAAEAREIIAADLPGLEAAARACAEGRPVSAALGREYYPTREYGDFALPAGAYTSLRITLGAGEGHNWWCVVFPPLCLSASEARSAMEALPESDAELITEGNGVAVRFRLVELWGELMALLNRK